MKTSNKFTFVRIIAAPIFFVVYFLPSWLNLPAGNLFSACSVCLLVPFLAFAEITDALDGYYARKHHEVSDFGKMFDPFADVFLHLSLFVCFVFSGYMPAVLFVLIFYREFSQNFLRMVSAKSGTAIAARKGGKLKTVVYVVSCFVSLLQECLVRTGVAESFSLNMGVFSLVGKCLYVLCVVLAYVSFIDYLKNFGSVLKKAAE